MDHKKEEAKEEEEREEARKEAESKEANTLYDHVVDLEIIDEHISDSELWLEELGTIQVRLTQLPPNTKRRVLWGREDVPHLSAEETKVVKAVAKSEHVAEQYKYAMRLIKMYLKDRYKYKRDSTKQRLRKRRYKRELLKLKEENRKLRKG